MNIDELTFDEQGLLAAIVQDAASKEVLTLAYMNRESLTKTIETGETWFFSRSRNELWHKGATSGNKQRVKDIRFDCDQDALLVLVEPNGPACHRGTYSCFTESLLQTESESAEAEQTNRYEIIEELETLLATREAERPEGSYTTYLFAEGVDKILKKVGEEASEVIIAAKNRDKEELTWESADLLYHWLVLLREQKLPLDDVLARLKERHGQQ
ncbi:bifunctional phosphoribosyl-AMP cyclohydrolase/phosphoribosyl-ATP diphosphatase HisIE [Salisediminibacterium halotolerans]|uniref:bifunctional phosphoribosyl-AMP cyclohydrolase/phosphoribosyl-ATP diphosphatase HisIE n=1 Tax=Salisediminibacterium halotolerans TaxID=517425 RepID=UPI000EB46370|nr:bifunctional phosphoribosyl-AMP cyclohydrolase/phosphoribosyl-ATP diphosphatase HisIE [Salisediminibacterium halotolerans]RLJ75454.1 phosphoribosyl-ATP pyrophosphatase /phosphoribosyl-AMP cyclohydrolase [Actinophytocola xinjiangensis]RPE89307.1 phosphoribosyl-ATP pyrophosphatase /phosphoribosyl-AMP cyclohydrolase [Salisediminibacterium halotolerans]TWG36067.1 phosphoribosyl-ATP pyrophosphatase /phosphoribosyl-AMP cyclohydrolase [Salisediminibacterium halotolerans]GEL07830.1 histidine biosynt